MIQTFSAEDGPVTVLPVMKHSIAQQSSSISHQYYVLCIICNVNMTEQSLKHAKQNLQH